MRLKSTGRVYYITDNYIKGYFTETRPISGCGEIFLKRLADLGKQNIVKPWLVWLSGLSASLSTKESPIQFPVRAHAWARSPVGGAQEATTH